MRAFYTFWVFLPKSASKKPLGLRDLALARLRGRSKAGRSPIGRRAARRP